MSSTIRTIQTNAAVDLESVLIGKDVDLDAREVTRESSHWATGPPVIRAVLIAVDDVGIVVSSAVEAAVALEFRCGEVSTNLLG